MSNPSFGNSPLLLRLLHEIIAGKKWIILELFAQSLRKCKLIIWNEIWIPSMNKLYVWVNSYLTSQIISKDFFNFDF